MSQSTPLAIVGLSAIFPQADDLRAYWRNLKAGTDAITAIPASHWRGTDFFNADPKAPDMTYAQRGGFISPVNFNPLEFGIAPKDIEATDTTQLLGMVAAKQALVDAGYDQKPFDRQRTSVLLGVTGALELVIPLGARLGHPIWRRALKEAGVANDVAEDVVQRIADGYVPWQENSFPGLLGNVAAGRIASRLDLGGTNCVVDAACASSFAALHLAALELEAGRSDMVITGGIDTFNDIFMFMCFSKTPALSPSGNSRPFDRDGDGTILGEGIGMIVLKRLADAERDGDKIYCVIKGIGSSSDGRGGAIYEPRSEGQVQAMERAYAAAGISPSTVELVEAHGTGTKVGDATELRSLAKVFRATQPDGTWAALGSVKSQIGHTKAAAGVAGLIKAALALEQKVLPPTIKVNQPLDEAAPGTSPFYLNTTKRPWLPRAAHPRRAGVSAFGFGGTNFHIALEEHGSARRAVDWTGDVDILAFAADTLADLRAQLAALPGELPWLDLRRRAHTSRAAFRAEAKFRLLLPLAKGTESNFALASLRDAALAMLDKEPTKTTWSLPNGTAFGSGPARGQLAVLFPGQGSQYPGMFRDLACQFPELLDTLAEADAAFAVEQPAVAQRLSDVIYPHPAFNDETRRAQESALKATEVAQPALGAVSLGALRVLQGFGVTPQLAAGHSYGELVALHAAGRLDAAGLHKLSNVRGRLMASRPGAADRGAMLAVVAPEQTVAELLLAGGPDLVIANRNSPSQFVIAGPKPQIDRAAVEAEKRSLRARVLPVSAAFHSPLVADAREPFAAALAEASFTEARIPVFSNTTATAYPSAPAASRDLLASHLAKPVDFIAEIRAMHAAGATTFLEVGPGRVLSDLAAAILADTGAETIALDASRGARNGTLDLATALCRLAALGHAVNLAKWETAPPAAPTGKPAFTVPISGANVRTSKPAPRLPIVSKPAARAGDLQSPSTASVAAASGAVGPVAAPQSPLSVTPTPLSPDLAAALQTAQQGMMALQKLQEQTAQLHAQFLAGQEAARRTLEGLLGQRRELLGLAPAPIGARTPTSAAPSIPVVSPERGSPSRSNAVTPAAAPALQTSHPKSIASASLAPTGGEGRGEGAAAAKPASTSNSVSPAVLAVVSEKTGYPVEMLTLDMGLDSDLGIDSIKRVEIMAALRTRLPDAPEVKPEHLGSLQTLQQVVDFLSVGTAATAPAASPGVSSPQAAPASSPVAPAVLAVVAEKTGYPAEMLTLEMGLDSDLGIDSIKRVEIMAALRTRLPDAPEVKPEHLGSLQTLQQVVEFLSAGGGATAPVASSSDSSAQVAPASSSVAPAVLAVVAEKTGYPMEMLTLDMGLDRDLGIDSIKRVEIMAALRTRLPDAPEVKPEHLGSLQTLKQVVEFLTAGSRVSASASVSSGAPANQVESKGIDSASATRALLAVVAEKTGYPTEMLNLDMGLDSDLGIDSIKRVEIMAALRAHLPDAPEIKPEHLGTLRTLQEVVNFLCAGSSQGGTGHRPVPSGDSPDGTTSASVAKAAQLSTPEFSIIPVGGSPTGTGESPVPPFSQLSRQILRPTPFPPADTRPLITLAPGSLVWLTDDATSLTVALAKNLEQRGLTVRRGTPTELLADRNAPLPAALVLLWPAAQGSDAFLKSAFRLIQVAAPALRAAGRSGAGVLVSLSRLDGLFGLGVMNATADVVSGGLAGLVKTAHHEWPEVHCKALDLDPGAASGTELANQITEEIFRAGPIEVSLFGGQRYGLEIETAPALANPAPALQRGDLVVVTGGARGVTATSVLELARRHQPRFLLLGRSTLPDAEPHWLTGLTSEADIKKALLAHAEGDRSPKRLEAKFREVMAQREIRAHLAEIRATGALAHYATLDVRDAAAVATTLAEVRAAHGPIRGLIHGAGVLADKLIEQKTEEQFDLVYGTKVHGLRNLLAATAADDLRLIALFSSYTGRFGRTGQVDYAAANEVLNKMAQAEARRRPQCRVVAFNWGPWNGGMVTEGLRKIFEREGVGLIEPEAGADFFVRDVLAPTGEAVEVLALAQAPSAVARPAPHIASPTFHPAFDRDVSVRALPCLVSHVMNGRAVLPAALIIEWLAHGAMHSNPGLAFHGFNQFKVLKGLVLEGDSAAQVTVSAAPPQSRDGLLAVPVQFTSRGSNGKSTLHATAEILLADTLPAAPSIAPAVKRNGILSKSVYGDGRLFHGPDFQCIEALEVCNPANAAALVRSSPAPKTMIAQPLRPAWLADPLALDAAFQLMILWSTAQRAAPSLPCALRSFRQFAAFPKTGGSRVVASITSAETPVAVADLQFFDRNGGLVALGEGYEFVVDANLREAFRQNHLPA
ncbi:MAG: SDR family NAD(P)-dependent oxidoreductase [Proteobacteria bacterium]|nr:SDR family NAD(P)-dependent oxidoreductase [Verrucomicrobiota bacterium]NBU09303.1 SDR family NAD(P)-dependent oxidoreductase [Pseudomonadota bacterium]